MTKNNEAYQAKISKAFEQVLNRHGYGFQYRILKEVEDLWQWQRSSWLLEVAEFPVEVQGHGTRIDFILNHRNEQPFYLLAECKRVNPSLSNWCFAQSGHSERGELYKAIILERAQLIAFCIRIDTEID